MESLDCLGCYLDLAWTTAASPGNLLDMQILRPHSDQLNQNLHLNKIPWWYPFSLCTQLELERWEERCGYQFTQTESEREVIAQREFECPYQKAEWMSGMQKQEISIKIYNMYSVIIIYQYCILYYILCSFHILHSIHSIARDIIR